MSEFYGSWRIASSEPTLEGGSFFVLGIIPPAICEYRSYAAQKVRTDGSTATHGWGIAELTWGTMSQAQYATLFRIIESIRETQQRVFMTIAAGDGWSYGEQQFIDISGFANAIEQRQSGPLDMRIRGAHYQGVILTLRNVAELNRPSAYS
jgi:hypothetical protein